MLKNQGEFVLHLFDYYIIYSLSDLPIKNPLAMKNSMSRIDNKATEYANMFEHGLMNHDEIMSITEPNTPMNPTLNARPKVMNTIDIRTIMTSLNIPADVLGQTVELKALGSAMRTFNMNCSDTPNKLELSHLTNHV